MSADLIAFLKAWYDWATSGAPDGEPFHRRHGLCPNATVFCPGEALVGHLRKELTKNLVFGGRTETPFGHQDYWERYDNDTQHLCPKRLAWVRARLVEAGEIA